MVGQKYWKAVVFLTIAAGFIAGSARGFQEVPAIPVEAAKKERDPLEFWFNPDRARAGAAAQVVLGQHPFAVAALRIGGVALQVWSEPEFASDRAPELNPRWLSNIAERDGKPMPNLKGRAPDLISKAEKDYIAVYNQAVVDSFQTPIDAFINSAKDNDHVTFAHMYEQTDKYRGKVIPVKGHLRRLRKFDAPDRLQQSGIKYIYEGWIAVPTYRTHPVCVLFPLLPDSLKPAENMDRWVEFYGYLINRYKYRSGRGDLDTPLLIGPTVIPAPQPPAPGGEIVTPKILYGLVGFIVSVALAVIVLNLWFRRGDRKVRAHLENLQAERAIEALSNPEPFEQGEPPRKNDNHR